MSEAVAAGLITAEQVAGSVVGERCWVRWPFLQEALVQAVSDKANRVTPSSPVSNAQHSTAHMSWRLNSCAERTVVLAAIACNMHFSA